MASRWSKRGSSRETSNLKRDLGTPSSSFEAECLKKTDSKLTPSWIPGSSQSTTEKWLMEQQQRHQEPGNSTGNRPRQVDVAQILANRQRDFISRLGEHIPAKTSSAQSTPPDSDQKGSAAPSSAIDSKSGIPMIQEKILEALMSRDKSSDASDKSQGFGARWTKAEDNQLRKAVKELGPTNWKVIASDYLGGKRTDMQCLHRWQKVLQPGLIKGPWTKEEDAIILSCREKGITKWSKIAEQIPGRIGKQCRERWSNHLDPNLKKGGWTPEEDKILAEAQAQWGNVWTKIAKLLPGRSENAVKNRWNTNSRRKSKTEPFPAKKKDSKETQAKKPVAGSASSQFKAEPLNQLPWQVSAPPVLFLCGQRRQEDQVLPQSFQQQSDACQFQQNETTKMPGGNMAVLHNGQLGIQTDQGVIQLPTTALPFEPQQAQHPQPQQQQHQPHPQQQHPEQSQPSQHTNSKNQSLPQEIPIKQEMSADFLKQIQQGQEHQQNEINAIQTSTPKLEEFDDYLSSSMLFLSMDDEQAKSFTGSRQGFPECNNNQVSSENIEKTLDSCSSAQPIIAPEEFSGMLQEASGSQQHPLQQSAPVLEPAANLASQPELKPITLESLQALHQKIQQNQTNTMNQNHFQQPQAQVQFQQPQQLPVSNLQTPQMQPAKAEQVSPEMPSQVFQFNTIGMQQPTQSHQAIPPQQFQGVNVQPLLVQGQYVIPGQMLPVKTEDVWPKPDQGLAIDPKSQQLWELLKAARPGVPDWKEGIGTSLEGKTVARLPSQSVSPTPVQYSSYGSGLVESTRFGVEESDENFRVQLREMEKLLQK